MPGIQTIYNAKATVLVGKDQAARVTNTASSGTLYGKSDDGVTSSSNDFSIAAAGSRLVSGPCWAVSSVDLPALVSEVAAGPAADALTPTRYWMHGPKDTSTGTDTTVTANRAYVGQIILPRRVTLTGAGFLIGGTGGTHKAIVAIYDRDGNVLAYSDKTGTTVGTLNTYQELAFTTPLEIVAPGKYFGGVIYSGTTPTLRTAIVDGVLSGTTNSASDFSAAPIAITVPTSSAANVSPQGFYVY